MVCGQTNKRELQSGGLRSAKLDLFGPHHAVITCLNFYTLVQFFEKMLFTISIFPILMTISAAGGASDLGLSVTVTPGGITPPGSEIQIALGVTNNGPDAVSGFGIRSGEIVGVISTPARSTCRWQLLSDPPSLVFTSSAGIDVGATETCNVTVLVDRRAVGFPRLAWQFAGANRNDPNPANDRATMRLAVDAPPVPAGSPIALVALTVLIAVAAYSRQWS